MIALIALLAAVAPAPTSGSPQTSQPAYDTVTDPNWISVPSKSMMLNCTTGYLTDPKFTSESIVMACLVHTDGSLSGCKVRETRRAEAAGVQDVAVCASAGFRIGPVDKFGRATAGRPIVLPLAIVTGTSAAPPATSPTPAPPTGPPKP